MSSNKNKSVGYIGASIVIFIPNVSALIFSLSESFIPPIVSIVSGIMVLVALFLFRHGLRIRKTMN